ncbi:hypothetical protein BO82DRAFT_96306 [Aspergillus uvarum CBS 121591]|uniref:Uncharacterized protein n=1 Tax=Aspergillus uvarum CBS 121591 TaxID=1448315 RepID=A0A319C7I6_9EURO|nr:hypothetical protein BO82DRAFT_96306 [Aspergillus uvarum CBS 121591]PYH81184.1 hypothetical protein BO82DRAFT_96306 [Aspergillus uvarum CBS 121591]
MRHCSQLLCCHIVSQVESITLLLNTQSPVRIMDCCSPLLTRRSVQVTFCDWATSDSLVCHAPETFRRCTTQIQCNCPSMCLSQLLKSTPQ